MNTKPEKRDARKLSQATQAEFRRIAVARVNAGETQAEVARTLGVHPQSVWNWMRAYRKNGDSGIASRPRTGRPATLTAAQEKKLRRWLIEKTPEQLKFPFVLWTLPLVRALIEREFKVAFHKSTVSRLLGRMGFTPQKPTRRAFSRDDAECVRWESEEFPGIVNQARRRQSTVLFGDEAGVHEDGPIARTWGLKGQRPVVRVSGGRRRVNVISAISPRGRLWFRCFKGNLNAARFIEFLKALKRDIRGPIELLLDKHPAHAAAATRKYLLTQTQICVHYLPSYAPDLNPDEHVWGYLKGLFRREPLGEGESLDDAVEKSMKQIKQDKPLIRAFFHHPETRYVTKALPS